ncbi:flavodoxin domain-containing protein [Cellulomonas sp. KRMCY2]|uniref:flavodoxin domain-containing protein n=1 Tax=Cellulomonas sp. KRMCY2 TaxID=1304865 RepID=UPI00045E8F1F|nr:flavodoxin domain-containing protein [Cellulomonas sp. KRMCY2]
MTVLVAYASRYGATAGIAERIAETLTASGHPAEACHVSDAKDVADHEAVVVGSAVYFGSWMKDATAFVERNSRTLADRPVWMFSSGPLPGAVLPEETDNDPQPKGLAGVQEAIGAKEHRIFDGALDPRALNLRHRLVRALPAGRPLLPEVDGRDWPAIDAFARSIGAALGT